MIASTALAMDLKLFYEYEKKNPTVAFREPIVTGLASKTIKTSQSSNDNFIWEGLFFITAVLEHKTTRLENGEKMRYHTDQRPSKIVLQWSFF